MTIATAESSDAWQIIQVRQIWIDNGLVRTTINDQTAQIKLMFKWTTSAATISEAGPMKKTQNDFPPLL